MSVLDGLLLVDNEYIQMKQQYNSLKKLEKEGSYHHLAAMSQLSSLRECRMKLMKDIKIIKDGIEVNSQNHENEKTQRLRQKLENLTKNQANLLKKHTQSDGLKSQIETNNKQINKLKEKIETYCQNHKNKMMSYNGVPNDFDISEEHLAKCESSLKRVEGQIEQYERNVVQIETENEKHQKKIEKLNNRMTCMKKSLEKLVPMFCQKWPEIKKQLQQ